MEKIYMNGYVIIHNPNHNRAMQNGYVYEHILIAEIMLGRKLKDDEVVHHEDENRSNNSRDNLYVFATKADHVRYHKNGIKIKIEDYYISPSKHLKSSICENCNKDFHYYESVGKGIYCSNECRANSSRKAERPSKEELLNLIKTISFVKIGEMYGVSDNAIRKWCKSYGLPHKKKDLKNLLTNK